MLKVYEIDGVIPVVHPSAFVHPSAVLIGDVVVGPGCYVGPCASLRGDFGPIRLEEGSNVQDTCVIHGFMAGDTVVERNGHVGHGAVLHCCRIGEDALVGMNAVVLDEAVVGESAWVAAAALVRAGFEVPPRHLAAGTPAKVVRPLTAKDLRWKTWGTRQYQALARRSGESMRVVEALTEPESDRPRLSAEAYTPLHRQER
ncbi:MAG TPA: phenylacetic acid degradation protein PaaY [Gammaproteobacteria bacterium]|nr:phenylacetic acid degradation protein PaaY [Gammaproteobacteria bacterium]